MSVNKINESQFSPDECGITSVENKNTFLQIKE